MSRSSARSRGQTEVTALVAVFAVCAGLALYVGVLDATLPAGAVERQPAAVAADRAAELASVHGVARPGELDDSLAAAPSGRHLNVSLVAGGERWSAGPAVPGDARTATRRVSVRVGPGRIEAGVLRAAVWR